MLLSYDPDSAVVRFSAILRGIMSDHELQTLHSLQAGFESFAGLDKIELSGIVGCLGGDGGIVRCSVEKGRMIEIGKDYCRQYWS